MGYSPRFHSAAHTSSLSWVYNNACCIPIAVSCRRLIKIRYDVPCNFAGKLAIRRQRLVGVYAITSCTALHTCENLFHFPGEDHYGIGAMGASEGEHLNAPGRSLIEETMTSLPASENKQAAASVFHWVNLDTGLCPMDPKAPGAGCQVFLPRRVTLKRLAGLPSTYTQSDANVSTAAGQTCLAYGTEFCYTELLRSEYSGLRFGARRCS